MGRSKIEAQILGLYKPVRLMGKDSDEIKMERNYVNTCCMIGKELNIQASQLSTSRFYLTLDYLEKLLDTNKKKAK